MHITKPIIKTKKPDNWGTKADQCEYYIDKFTHENQLKMSDSKHIMIVPICDPHFGNTGVRMKLAGDHAKLIGKTENCYAFLAGDATDNFVNMKIVSAMVNKNSSPVEERQLLDEYLGFFNNHVLLAISGNHEEWSKALAGIDLFRDLYKKHQIFYGQSCFYVELTCGKNLYRIYLRHKYRFNSSINQTHTVKQMLRMDDVDFDIGIVAHNHEAAFELFLWKKLTRLAIRGGSYKVADAYGRQMGFNQAVPIMPSFICRADHRAILPFENIEEGVDYLNFLNRRTK